MNKSIILAAALAVSVGVANAQISPNSVWYDGDMKLLCVSASGNTFTCNMDYWGEEPEEITLTKTAENKFSLKGSADVRLFANTKSVEYRVVDGHKLLIFKDSKGNVLESFERGADNDMWEPYILNAYNYILDGEYVDEQGTKYTISGDEFVMGGKKMNFSLDLEQYYLMEMSDDNYYWWRVSTTGINIYRTKDGEYGREPGALWHKLKNVSPNGRWGFLATEIVPGNTMWRFNSELIRLMRNEIYARHGYVFNSADLKNYFGKQPWYKPLNNNAAVKLSAIETLNVELLKGNIVAREGTDDEEIEEGLK